MNSEHDGYLFKCEKCDIKFEDLVEQEDHNDAFDEMFGIVVSYLMVYKDILHCKRV